MTPEALVGQPRVWWLRLQLAAAFLRLAALLNLTASVVLLAGAESWSRAEASPPYTYPVHMRGSYWRYYRPLAGRSITWSFPAILGAAGLLVALKRVDRLMRRRRP